METIKNTITPSRFTGYIATFTIALLISTLITACGSNEPPPAPEPEPRAAVTVAPEPTHTPVPPPTEAPDPTAMPDPTEPSSVPTKMPEVTAPVVEPTPMPEATPTPAPAPTVAQPRKLELDGVWWERKQKGDTTPVWVYEQHPHTIALDLMDGRFNHHPELDGQMNRTLSRVANEYYTKRAHATVQFAIADKIDEHMNHGTRKRAKTLEDFIETAGWEITHIERAEVRYWGKVRGLRIGDNPVREYLVGFTVQWETDQPIPPLMGDQVFGPKTGNYPIENFLDHPKLTGEVIVEPVQ